MYAQQTPCICMFIFLTRFTGNFCCSHKQNTNNHLMYITISPTGVIHLCSDYILHVRISQNHPDTSFPEKLIVDYFTELLQMKLCNACMNSCYCLYAQKINEISDVVNYAPLFKRSLLLSMRCTRKFFNYCPI